MSAYRERTPIYKIIEDGWSRGFDPTQTFEEVIEAGYKIDFKSIPMFFKLFEDRMKKDFKIQEVVEPTKASKMWLLIPDRIIAECLGGNTFHVINGGWDGEVVNEQFLIQGEEPYPGDITIFKEEIPGTNYNDLLINATQMYNDGKLNHLSESERSLINAANMAEIEAECDCEIAF